MKLKLIYKMAMALALITVMTFMTSAKPVDGDYDWLKQRLANTKAFTIEVINAMPKDKYNYKPNDDVRTFKQQAYHVVYTINYYNRLFSGDADAKWVAGNEDSKTKEQLITWANEEFDKMEKIVLAASNNQQLTSGIIGFLDHNAHHRGQMITYLRNNKITAPNYR